MAASVLVAAMPQAESKTVVKIYLGYPHHSYKVGSDYVYRRGYGWYSPRYHKFRVLTRAQARARVVNHGYHNVSKIECQGATFTFQGQRAGHRQVIHVNARTGGVW